VDAQSGKPISEPLKGHYDAVHSAECSSDGKRIVTASGDQTARVWNVFPDTQALVSQAEKDVPRCLTTARRRTFFLPSEPPDLVHRDGEVALQHARMETMARRKARRQEPAIAS
jgi:WD40 repeat protein